MEQSIETLPEKIEVETQYQSDEIGALAEALAKVQGEIETATRDSENPFYKSKYADLASIWDACRKQLAKNQLAVIQTTQNNNGIDGTIILVTTLAHSSGQWIRGFLKIRPIKNDPQGIGSAITYARRYALSAIVGVAPKDEDDDAENAMNRNNGGNKSEIIKPLNSDEKNIRKRIGNYILATCNDDKELAKDHFQAIAAGLDITKKYLADLDSSELSQIYEKLLPNMEKFEKSGKSDDLFDNKKKEKTK